MSIPNKPWTQLALGIIAGIIASLGIVAVNIAGFSLSFDAIRTVGRAAHINIHLDWMLPVAIDGAMAVASVTAIVMQRMDRVPWYPWIVVLANVLISVGCNALHAYQGGGEKPLPAGWAMAVSAIPALDLALSLHLAIELVLAVIKRGEKAPRTQPSPNAFAGFAPTTIHGGTQPQPAPATQVARTVGSRPFAATPPAGSLPPAQVGTQRTTHPADPPASRPANRTEKAREVPTAKPAEKAPANPSPGAKAPTHPFADDLNPSIRALARAYSRSPLKTNAELAKQAKVSEGTANRYLPKIRAAAIDSADADADELRAEQPLPQLPIPEPIPPVNAGVNGHPYKPEEN